MEPKLLLFLKPDSNIARFQSLFDIVETFSMMTATAYGYSKL